MSKPKNRKAARNRSRTRRWGWSVGLMYVLLFFVTSCEGNQGHQGDSPAEEERSASPAERTELFDRRYAYLMRGDAEFPTLTSQHRVKTRPLEDNVSRVEIVPDAERPVDGEDSCQVFKITLKRDAAMMVVVADSIGSGLVAFEFGKLPSGEYTLGTGKFPPELTHWTNNCKRLVISLTVENTIRHRARWIVTKHGRLSHRLNF